jgi:hypothetical protein
MSNHAEALAQFRQGPSALAAALQGASAEETAFVPGPGKWTIKQLVRHVADTEIVVGMRMRQIIAEDSPTLIPFDQEKWAANLSYETADAAASLVVFETLREDTVRVLEALPAEAFDRPGVHPERGTKPLVEWVQLFARHVFTHADQIRGIREAWRKQ